MTVADASQLIFTFHNVSINTYLKNQLPQRLFSLHSIMFLLIPKLPNNFGSIRFLFTFHNVSINTKAWWQKYPNANIFTFHNVSINTI